MALSEAIKARRQALKLSQEYVADQLGISRQAVAKWEAGSSTPTADSLARLADLATAACLIALNLKYWRHIWPVREPQLLRPCPPAPLSLPQGKAARAFPGNGRGAGRKAKAQSCVSPGKVVQFRYIAVAVTGAVPGGPRFILFQWRGCP